MARRGGSHQGPPTIMIEVEGQVIPISGPEFGTILMAIKALPGVDGKCFNADRDGRGKRWVIPGTRRHRADAARLRDDRRRGSPAGGHAGRADPTATSRAR